MSIPALTNNIVINQVPLTTVMPSLTATTAVLAPTAVEPNGEIKTGVVVETIAIPSSANLVQPVQNANSSNKHTVVPTVNSTADQHTHEVGLFRIVLLLRLLLFFFN